eukprot:1222274-Alexandrium_andersonii.AAC.1
MQALELAHVGDPTIPVVDIHGGGLLLGLRRLRRLRPLRGRSIGRLSTGLGALGQPPELSGQPGDSHVLLRGFGRAGPTSALAERALRLGGPLGLLGWLLLPRAQLAALAADPDAHGFV